MLQTELVSIAAWREVHVDAKDVLNGSVKCLWSEDAAAHGCDAEQNGDYSSAMQRLSPPVGLEPTTTGLKGQRSTNWARRVSPRLIHFRQFNISALNLEDLDT